MSQENHQKELNKILSSKEGRELIRLLSADGGETMKKAGQALRSGDEEQAKKTMEPLLNSPQIKSLMNALEQAMKNHG